MRRRTLQKSKRHVSNNWKTCQHTITKTHTPTPSAFASVFAQRRRWNRRVQKQTKVSRRDTVSRPSLPWSAQMIPVLQPRHELSGKGDARHELKRTPVGSASKRWKHRFCPLLQGGEVRPQQNLPHRCSALVYYRTVHGERRRPVQVQSTPSYHLPLERELVVV